MKKKRGAESELSHLVYVVVGGDGVEACVEVVEQVHNLHWGACRRYRGEANNVAEQKVDN